jgi:hypothetical protein
MITQEQFTERAVAAVADLGLFYAGTSSDHMMNQLRKVQSNLESGLADAFGPDVAGDIAAAFVIAVKSRKLEIESACIIPERNRKSMH